MRSSSSLLGGAPFHLSITVMTGCSPRSWSSGAIETSVREVDIQLSVWHNHHFFKTDREGPGAKTQLRYIVVLLRSTLAFVHLHRLMTLCQDDIRGMFLVGNMC